MQENNNVGANKGWKKFKEVFMEIIFLIAACVSIAAVALICKWNTGNKRNWIY